LSEDLERAQHTMEGGGHAHLHSDTSARRVAVLVAVIAAALALAQIGAKSAQNEYLTHHVAVSDDWAFYQAKNVRAVLREAEAELLESLPTASQPTVQAKITAAREYEARMRDDPKAGDGMAQLAAKAKQQEADRDHAFQRYHAFELVTGAFEIAIVLASVSVVTRVWTLAVAAGALGLVAGLCGIAVAVELI